jgi:tetratricopeptide (TPR) repeat protein
MTSPSQVDRPVPRPATKRSRWKTCLIALAFGTLGWLLAGQSTCLVARRFASQGRLSRAANLIPWCQRLCPWDISLDWLAAKCARRLGDRNGWNNTIARWSAKSARSVDLKVERELMQIQSGRLGADAQSHLKRMIVSGIDGSDIAEAFVLGFIAQQNLEQANVTLAWWEGLNLREGDANLYRGVLSRLRGERDQARSSYLSVLKTSPNHELALIHLADLSLDTDSPRTALQHSIRALREAPHSAMALTGAARCLRTLGKWSAAQHLLKELFERGEPSNEVLMESGQIALELGHYAVAEKLLTAAASSKVPAHDEIMAIATTFSLSGHPADGIPLLQQDARTESVHKQQRDLQVDRILEPDNARILQRLDEITDEQRRTKP